MDEITYKGKNILKKVEDGIRLLEKNDVIVENNQLQQENAELKEREDKVKEYCTGNIGGQLYCTDYYLKYLLKILDGEKGD